MGASDDLIRNVWADVVKAFDHSFAARRAIEKFVTQQSQLQTQMSQIIAQQVQILTRLTAIETKENEIMADLSAQAAAIRANTDMLKSIQATAVMLAEGHATIEEEIAALKAANPAMDTTDLDAATAEQKQAIADMATIIPANVTPTPSP